MGTINRPQPVLLITAAFSRYDAAFDWARERCESRWGPVQLESPMFEFVQTSYYDPTMGPGQMKRFWAFEQLVDPGTLAQVKCDTNDWEAEYAASGVHPEPRPLNLDPGYITLGKLVLASTKDHAHRIYLANGIYAETTLHYRKKQWRKHEWTFADYQEPHYHQFFDQCRAYLHERIKAER